MNRPTLRISAEHQCWPTWLVAADGTGSDNPDPADLGLPEDLVADLVAWGDAFDAVFPEDDPGAAAFPSEAEQAWQERGAALARRVKDAVGDRYRVEHHVPGAPWTEVR